MNKADYNKSDNSIDKSVARSSSGVSTQVSTDGVFVDKDNECQILYGNLFSKFPHPELNNKSKNRSQTSQSGLPNNDETLESEQQPSSSNMFSTFDRHSATDTKSRRHSEANSRSFHKRKQDKRRSSSNDLPNSSSTIEKLLATLNDVKECNSPSYYSDGQFFRNPQIPQPSGDLQFPISSKIPMENILTTDILESIIERANANPKEPFFSVLDGNSKVVTGMSLTYAKLVQRAERISCYITSKLSNTAYGLNVRPGQSVALVFSKDDAIDFVIGFFACLFAKVIAVPVEKPSLSQLSSSALTGKYLNQLGVSVILTNTNCHKEINRKGIEFPQWKDLFWVSIDSYYNEKLPKNYLPPESCTTFDVPLYVEYVYSDQHTLRGVPVSHESTLHHCQALKVICRYTEGQPILCTDDIRHQTGLWHCVLTAAYCGMNTLFLPYTLVKKNPACWINAVTKHKVKFMVSNSRVLHHSLSIEKKEFNGVDLSHLNTLLVADACVPWINETIDRFVQRFQSVGLQSDVVLPCVSKSETLTICMRRRNETDKATPLVQTLCLESLSYDLIKEVSKDSNSMTVVLESSGFLLPSMKAAVVRLDNYSQLCREDEIGEICVSSKFSNRVFWMTPDDVSTQYLSVNVNVPSEENHDNVVTFTRTGLVGFFRPHNGMNHIFIHGSLKNFIEVSGRRFNSDDIIGTVSVVKPLGVLNKGRCCVFTVPVLDHSRLVIAIEVNTEKYSDNKIYDWISNVLQAILNLHQLNVYCVVGIVSDTFPKTLLGDINVNDTMIRFMRGSLNITHLTLCPQTAITNLPGVNRSATHNHHFSPASLLAHAMHSQSFASVSGISTPPITKTSSLIEILEWRATHTPDHLLFSVINSKLAVTDRLNCEQLYKKAERIASLMKDKIKTPAVGSVVAIILNNPLELTCALYGCYYLGMVPLILNMPDSDTSWLSFNLTENIWACKHSKAILCLTSGQNLRLLKSKECSNHVPTDLWPQLVDISEAPKKKPLSMYSVSSPEKQLSLIRCHVNREGLTTLSGWTHSNIVALCEAHKLQNDLAPGTEVALCIDTISNTGIFLNCISPIYCGHHSFIVSPSIMNTNPDTWLLFLHRKLIKHTFCSELALSQSVYSARFDQMCSFLKKPCLNLQHIESLIVCVNERPNHMVIREFLAVFEDSKFGLNTLSIGVDSPWIMGMFVQIPKTSYPRIVYLEKLALRNYRITESEESNDTALEVLELGQPVTNTLVLIVDRQSQCQKSINQLGELWVSSEYTCNQIVAAATPQHIEQLYRDVLNVGRYVCDSDTCDVISDNILSAKLAMGQNIQQTFAKTSLMGFLRSFGPENQLIVLGRADDVIEMRGFTYFPTEIEDCIRHVDTEIINQSIVFTESDLLIAVVEVTELCKAESCFKLLPKLAKSVVESFLLPLGIVQFVKYGEIFTPWTDSRRRIKTLWIHKKIQSILQFYCL